jgi:hypothetical protein
LVIEQRDERKVTFAAISVWVGVYGNDAVNNQ